MLVLRIACAFIVLMILIPSMGALAQGAGPPGPGAGGPVDGGAVALLAGAAFYGYKKLKSKNPKT